MTDKKPRAALFCIKQSFRREHTLPRVPKTPYFVSSDENGSSPLQLLSVKLKFAQRENSLLPFDQSALVKQLAIHITVLLRFACCVRGNRLYYTDFVQSGSFFPPTSPIKKPLNIHLLHLERPLDHGHSLFMVNRIIIWLFITNGWFGRGEKK